MYSIHRNYTVVHIQSTTTVYVYIVYTESTVTYMVYSTVYVYTVCGNNLPPRSVFCLASLAGGMARAQQQ